MAKWVTHIYIDGKFILEPDRNWIYDFNCKLEIESQCLGRTMIELEKIEYDSQKFITQYFFKSHNGWIQEPILSKELPPKKSRLFNLFK